MTKPIRVRIYLKSDRCWCPDPSCSIGSKSWQTKGGPDILCNRTTKQYVEYPGGPKEADLVLSPTKTAQAYSISLSQEEGGAILVRVGNKSESQFVFLSFYRLIKRACKKFNRKSVWVSMELLCPEQ